MPWISAGTTKGQINSQVMPGKPREVISADLFTIDNSNFLCVVDYHSKFLTINGQRNYQQRV